MTEDCGAPESDEPLSDEAPLLPRLDAEAGPACALSERDAMLFAERVERQFARRARSARRLSPRRLLLAGGLFAASAAAAVYSVGVLQPESSQAPRPAAQPATPPTAPEVSPPAPPSEPLEPVAPPASAPGPPGAAGLPDTGLPDIRLPDTRLPDNQLRDAPLPPPLQQGLPETQERPAELPTSAPKSNASAPAKPAVARSVVADRLAAANGLRARHRYREALALYLQVIDIAPNGMQASVARVAAAEMLLEQLGDVAGAERLYREARTQGGELTAEAQFGLAQVARARGDAPAERRALQDFLLRHPESPLVAAARRRLSSLGSE